MAITQGKSPWILRSVDDEVEDAPVSTIVFAATAASGVFELSDGSIDPATGGPRILYRAVTTAAMMQVAIHVGYEWQDKIKVVQVPADALIFIHFPSSTP